MAVPRPYTVPDATESAFQANTWTSTLLKNPSYQPIETYCRRQKPQTGEDAFIATVINTPTTIPHLLTLQRKPDQLARLPSKAPSLPAPPAQWPKIPSSQPADTINMIYFAEPDLNGHPGVVHGGVISTLLDELMAISVAAHLPGFDFDHPDKSGKLYTMQLDVRFKRPVRAGAHAVLRTWCIGNEGRKWWVRAQLVQEENPIKPDGEKVEWVKKKYVCADAVGFFILVKDSKL
ncbi:hypothetical protein McanMca71_002499 [Microsporum canis]|uniref:Thioesterase family protein n=1 Tax=Arthroderma otae (strain ATCC MYA-4605 / CBS 113480) TaxID=554155 RepID=C5FYC6_ARTOC|nr:thioesterase family protein [Microsporum canis CBS 113480]EEQ34524.1 thioesterase family protein [Microsporum canis CBS 113480]